MTSYWLARGFAVVNDTGGNSPPPGFEWLMSDWDLLLSDGDTLMMGVS